MDINGKSPGSLQGLFYSIPFIRHTTPIFSILYNNLTFPDGTKFYPDKQGGEYGFNTDAARGADTFSPFKSKPDPITVSVSGNYNEAAQSIAGTIKNIGWTTLIVTSGQFRSGLTIDGITSAGQLNVRYNISNLENITITAKDNRASGSYSCPSFVAQLE